MEGSAAYYTPDLKIKDARFSIDYLQDYSLLLQAGESGFDLAVIDTKSNRCLLLEHYKLHNANSKHEYQKLLEALFEEHHLLMAGFWHSVRFTVKNSFFSLIPTALFDKEQLETYLRLTSPLQATESLLYYRHLNNNIVNVFSAEHALISWLEKRYANLRIKVLHNLSPFIEGVLTLPQQSQPALYMLLDGPTLTVVISHKGKLEYANIFRCSSPADMIRYVMMIVKQFGLSQQTVEVTMWGNFSADSGWYRELKPYFAHMKLGGRPKFLSFNYGFDEVPEHRFFDLFSQFICE